MKKEPKTEKLEIVHGRGSVFRDLGIENADGEQFKAILAAEIIRKIDRDGQSLRKARSLTGIAAAEFSRIRSADLGRFTIDRLMIIVNRLGSRIDVAVKFWRTPVGRQGRPLAH
jgi:predicted XRE-type DNA-binding protein